MSLRMKENPIGWMFENLRFFEIPRFAFGIRKDSKSWMWKSQTEKKMSFDLALKCLNIVSEIKNNISYFVL